MPELTSHGDTMAASLRHQWRDTICGGGAYGCILEHLKTAILNILHLAPNSLSDIVCYVFERPINRSIWSIMQRLVIGVVVYFVWQVQNLRIFQMQSRSISELCGIIRQNERNLRMFQGKARTSIVFINLIKDVDHKSITSTMQSFSLGDNDVEARLRTMGSFVRTAYGSVDIMDPSFSDKLKFSGFMSPQISGANSLIGDKSSKGIPLYYFKYDKRTSGNAPSAPESSATLDALGSVSLSMPQKDPFNKSFTLASSVPTPKLISSSIGISNNPPQLHKVVHESEDRELDQTMGLSSSLKGVIGDDSSHPTKTSGLPSFVGAQEHRSAVNDISVSTDHSFFVTQQKLAFSTAYEQLAFCELFHQADTGWRECTSCGKRLHCGCIASSAFIELLNNGVVRCVGCISNSRPDPSTSDDKLEECGVSVENSVGEIRSSSIKMLIQSCDVTADNYDASTSQIKQDESLHPRREISEFAPGTKVINYGSLVETDLTISEEPHVFGKGSIFTVRLSGEQDQWAQCDNYSKWRRLPVDFLLPSKWTCQENLWDHSSKANIRIISKDDLPKVVEDDDEMVQCITLSMKPKSKISAEDYSMWRTCGICGWKEGHNSNTYSQKFPSSKKPRQQLLSKRASLNATIVPLFEKVLSASDAAGRIGRLVLPKACTKDPRIALMHSAIFPNGPSLIGVNTIGDANWLANENHNQDALDLKYTWEEFQDMLFPPSQPSTVTIDDQEFEEYKEPPVFGKGSVFTVRLSGRRSVIIVQNGKGYQLIFFSHLNGHAKKISGITADMRRISKANIRIISKDDLPKVAEDDDEMVQLSFFNTCGENSQDRSQMMDGQIVTDSDEEDDDDEEDSKEIFDSAALAAF
ncbi:armadillo-like helical domain-containing protein [Tanacetum coccineum]